MDRHGNPAHGMVMYEQLDMSEVGKSEAEPEDPVFGQRFGRMFPDLEPADHDVAFLRALGQPGGPMDESAVGYEVGDSSLPAGNAFVGQYIDHTITLDVRSELGQRAEPRDLRNFRTPRLDLDSLYGVSPEVDNHLYHQDGPPEKRAKLLVGVDDQGNRVDDLPRNHEGVAMIGDPRNDENTIISQMQLAFIRFHNRVVDALADTGEYEGELLERAQELVRRHFQYVVVNQFLPRICQHSVLEDILENGRRYFMPEAPEDVYIPVEFAGAAYRYGHSQIRQKYKLNDQSDPQLFFTGGFQPVPPEDTVQWKHFFEIEDSTTPQACRKIDPLIPPVLLDLPFIEEENERSLAARNLLRGYVLKLPSGPAVARELGVPPLPNETIGLEPFIEEFYANRDRPDTVEAPLWYYILAEARRFHSGDRLGPVGSRIVAETLIGLIEADPTSYRNETNWQPMLSSPETDTPENEFRIQDILADGPLELTSHLPRSVIIDGVPGDGTVRYSAEVSGNLERAAGTIGDVSLNSDPNDTIEGSRADGWLDAGAAGYRFDGDITALSLTDYDQASVYIDEQMINPRTVGRKPIPRTLVVEGSGPYVEYSFTVSGDLEQVSGPIDGMGVSVNPNDTIDGSTANASVAEGRDGFRFSGEITEFSTDSPDEITVYVDGKAREVETLASDSLLRTLVIEGTPTGPGTEYMVRVSEVIKQVEGSVEGIVVSKDASDIVDSPEVTGIVLAGADGFRFSGDIAELSIEDPGQATVYVDGEVRDPEEITSES